MIKESSPQIVEKREEPAPFRQVITGLSLSDKPFWHEKQLIVEDALSKDNKRE